MNFDINNVVSDMLSVIKGTVADNWKKVKPIAEQFLQREKERLGLLAALKISGDLNEEGFESRLNDSKLIVEAELNAISVISKAIAQNAANAAIEVFEKAVKTAISSVI